VLVGGAGGAVVAVGSVELRWVALDVVGWLGGCSDAAGRHPAESVGRLSGLAG